MEQIETIFANSGRFHDRYFGESFTLPYDFETIKIQPNELATYRVVNDALSKLYENFLYLYGLTRVSSNMIPDSLSAVAGVSAGDTQFRWYSKLPQTQFGPLSAAGVAALDDVTRLHITYSNIFERYILFAHSDNIITILETNADSSLNVV